MQNFCKAVTISVPETDPYSVATSSGPLFTVSVIKAIPYPVSPPVKKFKKLARLSFSYQDLKSSFADP
jgi:hypothetical protein